MTVLQQMARDEAERREELRLVVGRELRASLGEFFPGQSVTVFGSLVKLGCFSDVSDIDLAIEREPAGMTICQLTSLLGERFGRRVDIVVLSECRFRDRILREGKVWTPQG